MRTYNSNEISQSQVLHDIKNIVDKMLPACNKAQESINKMSENLSKEIQWPEPKNHH